MRKLSFLLVFTIISFIGTNVFSQVEEVVEVIEQERVEILISDLPEAITNAISSDFADYTTEKVFIATQEEQDVYSVQLTKANDTGIEVLFDAAGKVIEQKDL